MIYLSRKVSVSCLYKEYQVILFHDNDPYYVRVVNVIPGVDKTVSVIPGGRYCILEIPIGDNFGSKVRNSKEFIAQEKGIQPYIIIVSEYITSYMALTIIRCFDIEYAWYS